MARLYELLWEEANRVRDELENLPVDDLFQWKRAIVRLAGVVLDLIEKLKDKGNHSS